MRFGDVCWGLWLLVATAAASVSVGDNNDTAGGQGGDPYAGWAQHPYCNDLPQIHTTALVGLTPEQADMVASLQHVQVVSRHGSRVPYARVFCWDGAGNNPMDAQWTCGASSVSSFDIGYSGSATGYGRLYAASYMAGKNLLPGTCIVGALLPLGLEQVRLNGVHLRDAYIGDGPLKLFASANLSTAPRHSIHLRSDDLERMIASGHALLDGIFPPEKSADGGGNSVGEILTWNLVDYANDYVYLNHGICPILSNISNDAKSSPGYLTHVNTTRELDQTLRQDLGNFSWDNILECLGIARCNNLPLPKGINETLFDRAFHEVELHEGLLLTYNDSWYARVAMQPLMEEMLAQIDLAVQEPADAATRLSVFMAHDTSIMSLLAAIQRDLWDQTWTPYAGMIVIEIYKLKTGSHAARLLYQGQPQRIPECHDTLCPIEDFMKALAFGRIPRNCTPPA